MLVSRLQNQPSGAHAVIVQRNPWKLQVRRFTPRIVSSDRYVIIEYSVQLRNFGPRGKSKTVNWLIFAPQL